MRVAGRDSRNVGGDGVRLAGISKALGGGGRDCVPVAYRDCEGTGGMQPKELIADIQARGVITFSTQKMAYLLSFLLHE